jgi:hypothetical protein
MFPSKRPRQTGRRGFLAGIASAVCLASAAALGGPGASSPALVLAERGKAAGHVIMRPDKASASQIHAAEELQKFIERQSGVRLGIVTDAAPLPEKVILVGDTRHTAAALGDDGAGDVRDSAALGDDGFRLVARGQRLLILGGAARGTLNGVYEVLERFGGCRWYASWHEVAPALDRFTVPSPLDETQRPAFAMRESFWTDMFDGDLAARNKVNGNSMRLEARHGGKVRFCAGLFVHTFYPLCPPAKYFGEHPEYFSLVKGRRVEKGAQLCLTNPEVLKIVTAGVLERLRKDPGCKLVSVSQNDCYNPCECADCAAIDAREGSHAGSLIMFVNRVAEAVEKEFPNVWVETLAYQYTRTPPKTVRPRHNVVPRLCSIECDFSVPLDESAFAQNKKFVADIQGWSAMTDKLYIWDYVTDFRDYILPFPNIPSLRGNLRFFRDNRVVGVFEEGAFQSRHAEFAELKAWLLAKWLWNPELPGEPLLQDFLNGYYGAAAPFVREYIDKLNAQYAAPDRHLTIYKDSRSIGLADSFSAGGAWLWARAEEAVRDAPATVRRNVRLGAIPALHAWLVVAPEERRQAIAKDLCARIDDAGGIRLSESARTNALMEKRLRALAAGTEEGLRDANGKVWE